MPCKNAGLFLPETLASIQNQDFTDWELIVVDDHSGDNSASIIGAAAESDSRIRLLPNSGAGIITALQAGLAECRGQYISRMDADDLMPPGRLQKMITTLRSAAAKTVVTGLVKYFAEGEISTGYRQYENWLNRVNLKGQHWQMLYRECVVASPNWMMRRDELLEIGGFEVLQYPEDYDLVFRWYRHDFAIKVIPETTLLWREHENRTSRNSAHYQQAAFFKLKIAKFVQNELKGENLLLWGTGRKGKLCAKILQKLGQEFRWMAVKPQNYPQGIYGHSVESFKNMMGVKNKKILVAVYPPDKERQRLQLFLNEQNMQEGRDYWFL